MPAWFSGSIQVVILLSFKGGSFLSQLLLLQLFTSLLSLHSSDLSPPLLLSTDLAAVTHKDDEYVWAGVEDPKIVVTTSHNPSSRLKQFAKVLIEHSKKKYTVKSGY